MRLPRIQINFPPLFLRNRLIKFLITSFWKFGNFGNTETEDKKTEGEQNLELIRAPQLQHAHPWLVTHHGRGMQRQVFYSITNKRFYKREIPELSNKHIWTSCSGWLVVEDRKTNDFFLFNPFTGERVQLPQLPFRCLACVLSSPPTDNNSQILFLSVSFSSIALSRLSDIRHEEGQKFLEHDLDEANLSPSGTFFEGKFYFLERRRLNFLDFDGTRPHLVEVIDECPYDESVSSLFTDSWGYLVESCGELLLVRKLYRGLFARECFGFSIFRANFHNKKWEKLDEIGQRAIFLDDIQGLSVSITTEEDKSSGIFKGNRIYFVEQTYIRRGFVRGTDRCLYVFNLDDQRTLHILPSPEINKCHGLVHRWVVGPS